MNIMQNNNLPVSLRLLFNNPFLEMMNVLFVINSFSKRSGLSIRHILFYYSLSISDSDPSMSEKKSDLNASLDNENIYFDIQSQIKKILLDLYSQKYITISNGKNDDFKCSLTAEGKKVLAQLESSYYEKLQERINTVKTKTKYSVEGEKIIMGVKK
jgi:hypothetical protein